MTPPLGRPICVLTLKTLHRFHPRRADGSRATRFVAEVAASPFGNHLAREGRLARASALLLMQICLYDSCCRKSRKPDRDDGDNAAAAAALAPAHLVDARFPRRDDRGHRTARHIPAQLDSRGIRRPVDWS